MTAFIPGQRQGVDNTGRIVHPFPEVSSAPNSFAHRNFYSTKLTPLKKYMLDETNNFHAKNIYHEIGADLRKDGKPTVFSNPLDPQESSILGLKQDFPNLDF